MNDDTSRSVATTDDKHTLTIERVADLYSSAGHSRTIRTLQRYCVSGHLDCLKMPTKLGDVYRVTPESVERHVAQLKEFAATGVATDRAQPRPTATVDAGKKKDDLTEAKVTTDDDTSRLVATTDDKPPYVAQLEKENIFLREQVGVKDTQIGALLERDKETNTLIHRLQAMLAPLLSAPGERHRETPPAHTTE
jgi:site-specific recombinase XerD